MSPYFLCHAFVQPERSDSGAEIVPQTTAVCNVSLSADHGRNSLGKPKIGGIETRLSREMRRAAAG